MIDRLARALAGLAPGATLLRDEPMSRHTSFEVGGPADLYLIPKDGGQVAAALRCAGELGVKTHVIGRGTNLLVRDGGIRGLVIELGEIMGGYTVDGTVLTAQAGAPLAAVCRAAREAGLSGLEFACGIPGTVGGGVAMNAGAYDGELKDALIEARVLLAGEESWWPREKMKYSYRSSEALRLGGVVLEARFQLTPEDPCEIAAKMDDFDRRRAAKQPLSARSAGSTFKRPQGRYAGPMIDDCGLRGARIGGAQVSEIHAGFLINAGGATASDLLALIELVRERVLDRHGVRLELEICVLGEDG